MSIYERLSDDARKILDRSEENYKSWGKEIAKLKEENKKFKVENERLKKQLEEYKKDREERLKNEWESAFGRKW